MKIKSTILPLLILSALLITGCTKDNDDNQEETSQTNKQMLTAHTWQVGEVYQSISGTRTHYLRGGENTTGVNMGAMRLKFNPDGTGTNTDISGTTFNMTWSFTSNDEKNLRLIVNGTVEYDWLFTDINKDFILQTALVSTNGLISAKWVPVL